VIDRRDKLPPRNGRVRPRAGLTAEVFRCRASAHADRPRPVAEVGRPAPGVCTCWSAWACAIYVEFDPEVIRGLDYYTGIVFEAQDRDGGRAILGGGHYDNLVGDVGGDPLPGVGFAMGDVMISWSLRATACCPDFKRVPADVLVTVFRRRGPCRFLCAGSGTARGGLRVVVYPEGGQAAKAAQVCRPHWRAVCADRRAR
jgi:histidyl-tRNA synthetase